MLWGHIDIQTIQSLNSGPPFEYQNMFGIQIPTLFWRVQEPNPECQIV